MKKVNLATTMICLLSLPLSSFSAFAAADDFREWKGTNGKSVGVVHEETSTISDSKINEMIERAKESISQEKKNKKNSLRAEALDTTYSYIAFEDGVSYVYEEASSANPELIILDSDNQKTEALSSKQTQLQGIASDFIADGVGGKQEITQSGTYLSTKLTLPQDSMVDKKVAAYNYGGFFYLANTSGAIGSWVADMGLSYYTNVGQSQTETGWKPIIIVKQKTSATAWTAYKSDIFDPNYKEGQYRNAYKSGSDVNLYLWYNYNGKVRLKLDGTTICSERTCTTPGDTKTITIIESADKLNIPQISNWKLLSTVVSNDNTGKNRAIYSNIKVDGTPVPNNKFSIPQEDHAKVTRDNNNTVTIDVDSDIYKY
ncbi:hypothetical protein E1B06_07820 [Brevibacillus laterosporus]|uniref:YrpD family protein n=1 Tax=Brevibacillus laterosporus TaxID=1465 RepID=UPI00240587E0|nr:YrpD family protein [Brevibacillus laterosporus]MDF9411630.1 hypothetical protein [Brevibacillus laterosporus]